MINIPYQDLLWKHRYQLVLGVFLFWLMLGLMVYLSEVIAFTFFHAPIVDAIEVRQYILRWCLWLLFTPFIIFLGLKINIGNYKLIWFIFFHVLLSTLLLTIEFSIEFSVLKPIAERFYHRTVTISEMIVPFLYKYFAYVINYFLMVGMVYMYVYMQRYYQTKEDLLLTELKNKELDQELAIQHLEKLKMQIRPHFLFNSLNALNAFIITKRNEEAEHMLSRLSELLQRSLSTTTEEFVTLQEELSLINLYIEIQQIRFGNRIQFNTQIASETCQQKLPFFILQPIVENAIHYRVEQTNQVVQLTIVSSLEQHQLCIEIRNTFHSQEHPSHGHGIGLSNVRNRLERYYGHQATLQLDINRKGITVVTLTLPRFNG